VFANPLGLLALLAVPAVVGLHLYRRRYTPQPVAALFLWAEATDTPAAGRVRQPLVKSPSFWCEFLAALLAALAFAGPRAFDTELPHRVVVIDGSASMAAADSDGASAWSRARSFLEQELGSLPARARVTLVASGPRPVTLAGPAAWRDEALAALATFEPGYASHDLATALDLGRGLAGDADVLLATDTPTPRGPGIAVHAFGRAVENSALVAARRTERDDGSEEVRATVAHFGRAPASTRLELVDARDGTVLAEAPLELAAGEVRELAFAHEGVDVALELRLAGDGLSVDDVAFLAPALPRPVRVSVSADAERLRTLMLASRTATVADRLVAVAPAVELVDAAAEADLVLDLDGAAGVRADAGTWVLRVRPPAAPVAWVGPFLVERRHPLLVGVELATVAWVGDDTGDVDGAPIVSAGSAVLVAERSSDGGREVTVNADLSVGTFVRTPDWPIMLANLVEWRRAALPGPREHDVVVGEELWVGAAQGGTWTLRGPSGESSRPGGRDVVFDRLDRPGLHELAVDERFVAFVGVSFLDPSESDLGALATGTLPGSGRVASALAAGQGRLEWLLGLLALAALALDGWFVARRGT
jgi:hypothetical protein